MGNIHMKLLSFVEFVRALNEGFVRNDEERQKMLAGELVSTDIPTFLNMIQKVLEENGGKYLVGSEVIYHSLAMNNYISINLLIENFHLS